MEEMWIARDYNGYLCLYTEKPIKKEVYFTTDEKDYIFLPEKMFPEVTFENSPKQLKMIIKG